ncbi:hypothetical protein A200_06933 [Parascardovia denticolens IPLA 20019]|uniref:sulfite exporter TauE/SafE family protein n=1 Tax=Parascardovia denticolens TaxID=78258 RepID=UPI000266D8BF|nr:sulfite exporter TauE/SafE family protein [Parascardovia denticolens]EIT87780.1 hypothetical protein A200_06933 [Parascardovia denticolens IPLA 20019]
MGHYILLIVFGMLMGCFTITLGGGAGAAYVSLLTLLFNVSPAVATTTSLAVMFPTAGMSTLIHARSHNVNFKIGLIMLGCGVVGSFGGSALSGYIPQQQYGKIIGLIIVGLTVLMMAKKYISSQAARERGKKDSYFHAIFFGVISGFLSGIAGTSGTTAIIAGLTILGCSTLQTVGTSVFVLSGLSLVGFLIHVHIGMVNWSLALILAASAVIGAIGGAFFFRKSLLQVEDEEENNPIVNIGIILVNLGMGIALLVK